MLKLIVTVLSLMSYLLAPVNAEASLRVRPMVVQMRGREVARSVEVTNTGSRPLLVRSEGTLWDQDEEGKRITPPNDGTLVVFPPVMRLNPGEARNLRVGTSGPNITPLQRGYRVSIVGERLSKDASEPDDKRGAVAISFNYGFNIAVLQDPVQVVSDYLLVNPRFEEGQFKVVFANTGNVSLMLDSVTFSLFGADGQELFSRNLVSQKLRVMAQRVREFGGAVPVNLCGEAEEARLTFRGQGINSEEKFDISLLECQGE